MRSPPFPLEIAALNRGLLAWERTYNTVRPHLALGSLTRPSSSTDGQLNERRPSVTDVPNEYSTHERAAS